jgi:hypothetical protein
MGYALERRGGLAIFLNKRAASVFMALRLRCARAYGSEEGVFFFGYPAQRLRMRSPRGGLGALTARASAPSGLRHAEIQSLLPTGIAT